MRWSKAALEQCRGAQGARASSERRRPRPAGEAAGRKPIELVRQRGFAAPFCAYRPTPRATELPREDWTFIDADLTVSLAREPEGEWLHSDAECRLGEDGAGPAMCRLADERGTFGRSVQSLLLERR